MLKLRLAFRRLRFIALAILVLPFSSCSYLHDSYVERFGNSILDLVGMGPEASAGEDVQLREAQELTREEEYYLGRAVAARILSMYRPVQDEALQQYVNDVGRAAAAYSDLPETFGGYHFMVIEGDEVNALAAPGGFIFVSRGMLRTVPDEDGLAAVLAHEVSHVSKRHGVKAISRENQQKALDALGDIRGSINCTEALIQVSALFAGAVQDIVTTLTTSGYSREQEYEADLGAREILGRIGYRPVALVTVLGRLEDLERQGGSRTTLGWFDTHPAPSDRLERLRHAAENSDSAGAAVVAPVAGSGVASVDAAGNDAALARRSARFNSVVQ